MQTVAPSQVSHPSSHVGDALRTAGSVSLDIAGAVTGVRAFNRLADTVNPVDGVNGLNPNDLVGMLETQRELQERNFYFSTVSAVQSSQHQTRMAVVREFKG